MQEVVACGGAQRSRVSGRKVGSKTLKVYNYIHDQGLSGADEDALRMEKEVYCSKHIH